MSQRISGYARRADDEYITPPWVTATLMPHIPPFLSIWEPAAGDGTMADALTKAGHSVMASDLPYDFLQSTHQSPEAVITNPPYGKAQEFIEHAMGMAPIVAMLLRTDYDHAATRQHLFGHCPRFAKKLVLTKRIRWFVGSTGAPSFNHAWFIWNASHSGPPVLAYGP